MNDHPPLAARVAARLAEEARTARERTVRSFYNALPPELRQATWDSVISDPAVPDAVLSAVNQYIATPQHNLCLLGEVGVGKTWMAVAAVGQLLQANETALFQPVSELFELWRGRDWSYRSLTDPYWLILDDLGGAHALRETEMDRFYAILNRRDQYRLPTVVTSNMDPDMLLHWIGARAWDRLRRGTVVLWPGVSRR